MISSLSLSEAWEAPPPHDPQDVVHMIIIWRGLPLCQDIILGLNQFYEHLLQFTCRHVNRNASEFELPRYLHIVPTTRVSLKLLNMYS